MSGGIMPVVTLAIVGDVMLGRSVDEQIAFRAPEGGVRENRIEPGR